MPRPVDLRAAMIDRQLRGRGIRSAEVLAAFAEVPREAFVAPDMEGAAYADRPLPIGEGQTISQPYIVARMIEAAGVSRGQTVLEVGAGSGYAAALLSRIAARVIAVERLGPLASRARQVLDSLGYDNAAVITGDGSEGCEACAPYDAIIVSAGSDQVPGPLLHQLAEGGRLVIPIGPSDVQRLVRITRTAAQEWREEKLEAVRFVPLIGSYGWTQKPGLSPLRTTTAHGRAPREKCD